MTGSTGGVAPIGAGGTVRFEPVATSPSTGDGAVARLQQIEAVPGSPGLYAVVDNRGIIQLLDDDGFRDTPLFDLREADLDFGFFSNESGLRSLAFHPEFAVQGAAGFGKVYLSFSVDAASGTADFTAPGGVEFHDVVVEFTVADPASPSIDADTAVELMRIEQVFTNHNIGQVGFNTQASLGDADYGLLYIGVGDGGGGFDPLDAGQDLSQIYGKILRIDPLGGAPYAIPADNPFVGQAGALAEIYAYGLRNPQQFSFHDGRMYASDIGQRTVEEVNVILAGENYGWVEREGTRALDGTTIVDLPANDDELGLQYPFAQYAHDDITFGNAAVGGGFVYTGDAAPELQGAYVFSNFPAGQMFIAWPNRLEAALADGRVAPHETRAPLSLDLVDADGEPTSFAQIAGNAGGRVDLRLAQTEDGEIFAFAKQTGTVWRLVDADVDLVGTEGPDALTGTDADDDVFARGGDDVVTGAAGADWIDGGEGFDVVSYAGSDAGVDVRLWRDGPQQSGAADGDVLSGVEGVIGSAFADGLAAANGQAASLTGGEGDDSLFGANRADTLMGEAGADQLWGRNGADTLVGGLGADVINGGRGVDTADYSQSGAGVDVRLWREGAQQGGDADGDVLAGVENIIGSAFGDGLAAANGRASVLEGRVGDDFLFGANRADTLLGGAGADVLLGRNGADRLDGGRGADTLTGGLGTDVFVIADRGGLDTLTDFKPGADTLAIHTTQIDAFEDLTLTDEAGGVRVSGYGGAGDTAFLDNVTRGPVGERRRLRLNPDGGRGEPTGAPVVMRSFRDSVSAFCGCALFPSSARSWRRALEGDPNHDRHHHPSLRARRRAGGRRRARAAHPRRRARPN